MVFSFINTLHNQLEIKIRIGFCILVSSILTWIVVTMYRQTHKKNFFEALKDFFIRNQIF